MFFVDVIKAKFLAKFKQRYSQEVLINPASN